MFSAVQHERGPRNSTIRRQMAMYLKETSELSSLGSPSPFRPHYLPPGMMQVNQILQILHFTESSTDGFNDSNLPKNWK